MAKNQVNKYKPNKTKKNNSPQHFKISTFDEGGNAFVEDIPIKSAKEVRIERKNQRKKEKYLSHKQPKKRIVTSTQTPKELNAKASFLKVIEGGKRSAVFKRVVTISVALIILLVITLAQVLSPTGVIDLVRFSVISKGSGDGFPLGINGDKVTDVKKVGNLCAVLSDGYIELYNSSSKEIFAIQHGYSNPCLVTSENRILVFDQGSTGFTVYDIGGELYKKNLKSDIVSATIARNGKFAIITKSDNYANEVFYYSKDNSKIFSYSSNDAVISASISTNGKYLALATIGAQDGDFLSKVKIFKDTAKPIKEENDKGLIISVDWVSKDTFAVTKDTSIYLYDVSSFENKLLIDNSTILLKDTSTDYGVSFTANKNNSEEKDEFFSFNSDGDKISKFYIQKSTAKIAVSDDYLVASKDYNIYVYDSSGKLLQTKNLGFKTEKMVLIDNMVLLLNNSTISAVEIK